MKKALGILFIFMIKCILGDDNIREMFFNNSTSRLTQDDTNPIFFYSRDAGLATKSSCLPCGEEKPEILVGGGPRVKPTDKYPWLVYIVSWKGKSKSFCGGALINEYFVLTAAHCTGFKKNVNAAVQYKDEIIVHFVMDSNRKVSKGPEVERVYVHPGYDGTFAHDISLIKLKTKVKCDESVKPICLPSINPKEVTPSGRIISVSGWGSGSENAMDRKKAECSGYANPSAHLKEAQMRIAKAQACRGRKPIYKRPLPFLLCLVPDQKEFTCSGDSGVPLFFEFKDRYFAVGVHSGRKGGTCRNAPKLANSIPLHMKWIEKVTGLRPDYPVARDGFRFPD